jgi:predicted secreted protein
MATTGILNGTNLLVYCDGTAIAHCTTCSLSKSADMMDISTKASLGWKKVKPGQKSWSVEVSGMVALDASYNFEYLMDLIINQTKVALKFKSSNNISGDTYFTGDAYLASVSTDAPNQAVMTYSASFTGTAVLTTATVT